MYNWTMAVMVAGLVATALLLTYAAVCARVKTPRAGAGVFTLIAADGNADGLEGAARGLRDGASSIIITDCGLSEYGRKLAELLTRDIGGCALISPEELPRVLEEYGWTGSSCG